MRFLNSVTVPKNVKGGPFGVFQHPTAMLQIIEKIEGGPFDAIQKFSKKKSDNAKKSK